MSSAPAPPAAPSTRAARSCGRARKAPNTSPAAPSRRPASDPMKSSWLARGAASSSRRRSDAAVACPTWCCATSSTSACVITSRPKRSPTPLAPSHMHGSHGMRAKPSRSAGLSARASTAAPPCAQVSAKRSPAASVYPGRSSDMEATSARCSATSPSGLLLTYETAVGAAPCRSCASRSACSARPAEVADSALVLVRRSAQASSAQASSHMPRSTAL
jgi:hypothetical protein